MMAVVDHPSQALPFLATFPLRPPRHTSQAWVTIHLLTLPPAVMHLIQRGIQTDSFREHSSFFPFGVG